MVLQMSGTNYNYGVIKSSGISNIFSSKKSNGIVISKNADNLLSKTVKIQSLFDDKYNS